jgi:glutamine amidotransferase
MGKPLLGICLGMQLLFEKAMNTESTRGWASFPERWKTFGATCRRNGKCRRSAGTRSGSGSRTTLCPGLKEGSCVYFVHSYYAKHCDESLVATAEYFVEVPAIVRAGNVWGTQFHPEKSGSAGLSILRAFCGEEAV